MEAGMSATAEGIALRLDQLFRSEVNEAKRLGYSVVTRLSPTVAVVRLVPKTQRTKRICSTAGATAIESTVAYDGPPALLEAVHSALVATLMHARDAAA